MRDRVAGALIAALVVVCVVLVLSVVYPISTAEPHAAKPTGERFGVGDAEGFHANGSIVADGDQVLAFEGAVAADGEWYQRVEERNVTSTAYHSPGDDRVYERIAMAAGAGSDPRREAIADDEDRELLRVERDGDRVAFVVAVNDSTAEEPVTGTASVFVRSLSVARYAPADTESSGTTAYAPRAGWYRRGVPYRLTATSGAVRVDADTGAVRSANVSWAVTVPAGTYARYALVRYVADGTETRRITFEHRPGDPGVERPAWAHGDDPE